MNKKLHIIELNLKRMQGHYVKYAIELSKIAFWNNYEVICWVSASSTKEVRSLLSENGVKVKTVFADDFRLLKHVRILRWIWQSILYWYVLKKIHKKKGKGDKAITYSGELEILAGAVLFYLFHPNSIPLFIQFFVWEVREEESKFKPIVIFIRRLTEIITKKFVFDTNINIMAQTELLSQHIEKRIKQKIKTCPMIINWKSLLKYSSKPKSHNEIPVIGYLGPIRYEKGFHLLIDALDKLEMDFLFLLHFDVVGNLQYRLEVDNLIVNFKKKNKIKIIKGRLSENEYAMLLNSIDIIVLPYDPDQYDKKRSSGIFAEAVGLGKVVVAHEDTWMGHLIKSHNLGKTFDQYNWQSLLSAIESTLSNTETLKQNSERFKSSWIKQNSIENFFYSCIDISSVKTSSSFY